MAITAEVVSLMSRYASLNQRIRATTHYKVISCRSYSSNSCQLVIKVTIFFISELKDHQAHDVPDCLPTKQTNPHENDRGRDNHSKNNERRIPSVQNDPNYLPSNKTKEPHERVGV